MSEAHVDTLLTAMTIVLAKLMRAEKERKGIRSTSDYIDDAASLIQSEKSRVIQLLR